MDLGAHVSCAGGWLKALPRATAAGCLAFQIFIESPQAWPRTELDHKGCSAFNEAYKDLNMRGFIHAPYLINLASPNASLQDSSARTLARNLDACARMGLEGVVLHIGSHLGVGWDGVKERVLKSITHALASTPSESKLFLENVAGKTNTVGSLPELAWILERTSSPRLGVCLDTQHAHAWGYDLSSPNGRTLLATDLANYHITSRLGLLHVNDSLVDSGAKKDRHADIGTGTIGVAGFNALAKIPQLNQVPWVLETPRLATGDVIGALEQLRSALALKG